VYDLLDVYRLLENYDMQRKYYVTVFVQSLSHLNSVANPIIYMLFSTSFLGGTWFVQLFSDRTVYFHFYCVYSVSRWLGGEVVRASDL